MIIMKLLQVLFYFVIKISCDDDSGWVLDANPLVTVHPCNGSSDIKIIFEPGRAPEQENIYNVWVHKTFPKYTIIKLKFDKGAIVTLANTTTARIDLDSSKDHEFKIKFFEASKDFNFQVQGCSVGVVPYMRSVNINTKEYCAEPFMGFLDFYIEGYKYKAQSSCTARKAKGSCGRRAQVLPLTADGISPRGDWPWHVALFKSRDIVTKYICGGTLITSFYVLTAGHCISSKGTTQPAEMYTAVFGKHNLNNNLESGSQRRKIEKIILHEEFEFSIRLDNDIALLKVKDEVMFTSFVQPACIFHRNDNKDHILNKTMGYIVGWGYDDSDQVPNELNQAQIPIISYVTCIRNQPNFYANVLNRKKFCAGSLNEALACNGDSGGALMVFLPDNVDSNSTGAWYVRGIISVGIKDENSSTCSGNHYTVFTDVVEFSPWIHSHINDI